MAPGGLVSSDAIPIKPQATGRCLAIYGEGESAGFDDYAIEPQYVDGERMQGRPLTQTLPDNVASDFSLRDAPFSDATAAEIQRLALPSARLTFANADLDNFPQTVQQLQGQLPGARIIEQGNVTNSQGWVRAFVVFELP
jgi:hypothetical protein